MEPRFTRCHSRRHKRQNTLNQIKVRVAARSPTFLNTTPRVLHKEVSAIRTLISSNAFAYVTGGIYVPTPAFSFFARLTCVLLRKGREQIRCQARQVVPLLSSCAPACWFSAHNRLSAQVAVRIAISGVRVFVRRTLLSLPHFYHANGDPSLSHCYGHQPSVTKRFLRDQHEHELP